MVKLLSLRTLSKTGSTFEGTRTLPGESLARLSAIKGLDEVHTVTLGSIGTQISGKLTEVLSTDAGEPFFLKFAGPTQLSRNGRQLSGHGTDYHRQGYSTPIGLLADGRATADLTEADVKALRRGEPLVFASGVTLQGTLQRVSRAGHAKLVYGFTECTIKSPTGKTLYSPKWGPFDLVASRGTEIAKVSVGPADPARYGKD